MCRSGMLVVILSLMLNACGSSGGEIKGNTEVYAVGAMRDVMWKGDLSDKVLLDTISPRKGLFGIGPASKLTGEIMINDGVTYVSTISADSSMQVEEIDDIGAPFFVYANVRSWRAVDVPQSIRSISALEDFIKKHSEEIAGPFPFKLTGRFREGLIHVQNLTPGSVVRSPDDAHQGQVNFELENVDVQIIGFYSESHQGIFTHHDSFLHMHLITSDRSRMGHLDKANPGGLILLLPD